MLSLHSMKFGTPRPVEEEEVGSPPPCLRGRFRPLTLREIYDGLKSTRPPFREARPIMVHTRHRPWVVENYDLAYLRHLYGPHVHLLDVRMIRSSLRRPLYCIDYSEMRPYYNGRQKSHTAANLRRHVQLMVPSSVIWEGERNAYCTIVTDFLKPTLTTARFVEAGKPPPPGSFGGSCYHDINSAGFVMKGVDPVYVLTERLA